VLDVAMPSAQSFTHPLIRWLMTNARRHLYASGPAVNLTARIESMCKQLKLSLLLSSDFAATSGVAVDPLGAFALKGVGAEQEIFAPLSDSD
jgi:adenylate cyclase